MGLLINQGKQVADDHSIIEAENVLCEVIGISLHKTICGALSVTFKIIKGDPKCMGKTFYDTVNYDSSSPMAWKYLALRQCAGVPYKKDEPEQIDIENLLLHKCVLCDLTKRLDKTGQEWQNCKYKKMTDAVRSTLAATTVSSDDGWGDTEHTFSPVDSDETIPF